MNGRSLDEGHAGRRLDEGHTGHRHDERHTARRPDARHAGRQLDDRHTAECERIAALLEARFPGCGVMREGELRRRERLEGAPLASATTNYGSRGRRRLHRPDLVLWPGEQSGGQSGGLPVAIEVELTLKTPRPLGAICRAWARCQEVAGVLYVAAPLVEPTLRRTIAAACAGERVWVLPLRALAQTNRPKPPLP
jgi:hypothetical protein